MDVKSPGRVVHSAEEMLWQGGEQEVSHALAGRRNQPCLQRGPALSQPAAHFIPVLPSPF